MSEGSTHPFDAHVVGYLVASECIKELDGEKVGAHELFTLGETEMPSSHHTPAMERTSESCWESGQMSCSRTGWTFDYHFGPSASQREKLGDGFDGNSRFHQRETGTPDLAWGLQCELLRDDGLSSSKPRPKTLTDTRFLARTSSTHCCGRAGLDGERGH